MVELNHAVAVGMARGPLAGLELVEALEASGQLAGYHLLPATRADFLRRLGRMPEAAAAYAEALELTSTDAERRYLQPQAGGNQRPGLSGSRSKRPSEPGHGSSRSRKPAGLRRSREET